MDAGALLVIVLISLVMLCLVLMIVYVTEPHQATPEPRKQPYELGKPPRGR